LNHYSRHIGDWRVATMNLTRMQRDIYSALIDTYYDKECPLTGDFEMLAEDHGCRSDEEITALRYVLKRYFKSDGGVYRHERCDEELAYMHHLIHVKSKAGKASGSSRAHRRMNKTGTGVQQASNTAPTESNTTRTTQYPIPNTHPVPDGTGGESAAAPTPTPAPPPEPKIARPTKKAPKDFSVTAEMASWVAKDCPLLSADDIERETAKLKDHTFSRAITDWVGAWRNWMRKEQSFRESRGGVVRGPAMNAKEAERQRVLTAMNDGKESGNGAGRKSAIDVEARVVHDSEDEEFPPE
jgi:uncharacterized protein YdaU (DUF1376 family)